MKAGFGTRNNDIESITDDSTPGKLNTDEIELIPDEVNSTGQVLMIQILTIKKIQMQLLRGSNSRIIQLIIKFNYQEILFRIYQILMIYQEMLQEMSQIEGEFQTVQKVIELMQGEHLVPV